MAGFLAADCLPGLVVGVGGREDEATTGISFLPSLEGGGKDFWSALLMAWFVGFLPLVEEDATVVGFATFEGVVARASRIAFGLAALAVSSTTALSRSETVPYRDGVGLGNWTRLRDGG